LFRLRFIPFFAPLIAGAHYVRKLLFSYISQIQVNYLNSSLAFGKVGKISAGVRLPYLHLVQNEEPTTIYKIVNELKPPFKILSYNLPIEQFKSLDTEMFGQIAINVNTVNNAAVKVAGLTKSFIIVVRPDNYIGYISAKIDIQQLTEFINSAYFLNGNLMPVGNDPKKSMPG